jgi:hypothetical protein
MDMNPPSNLQTDKRTKSVISEPERRAITYSMDALIPGLYCWVGAWTLRLGGSLAEDNYPGVLHRSVGIALVLPGYRIYSTYQTYQGNYDPS